MGFSLKGSFKDVGRGLAYFSKMDAFFFLVFGYLIGIGLLIYGIVLVIKDGHDKKVEGTVLSSKCTKNRSSKYSCNISYSYEFDDVKYTDESKTNISLSKEPLVGEKIDVYIDSKNPSSSSLTHDKKFGYILIISGCVLILIASLHFYLVNRFTTYAQITGFAGLANIFT
jgi:hypothetical protein